MHSCVWHYNQLHWYFMYLSNLQSNNNYNTRECLTKRENIGVIIPFQCSTAQWRKICTHAQFGQHNQHSTNQNLHQFHQKSIVALISNPNNHNSNNAMIKWHNVHTM